MRLGRVESTMVGLRQFWVSRLSILYWASCMRSSRRCSVTCKAGQRDPPDDLELQDSCRRCAKTS